MNKSPEKFDGELAVVLDRHLGSVNSVYTRASDYRSGEYTDLLGSTILEVIALTEQLVSLVKRDTELTMEEKKVFAIKKRQLNHLLGELRESRAISKNILSVLLEGRVKLGIWIDSIGGYTDVKESLRWTTDRYRENGSKVFTYVDVKAASAAFDIAFMGNEISALNRSVFLWHFSDSDSSPRVKKLEDFRKNRPLDEIAEEELIELREIVEMANDEYQDELWRKIHADLHNPKLNGDIIFDGRDLHDAGLIDHCFTKPALLREKFAKDLPAHAASYSGSFIEGIYDKIHKKLSRELDWFDPKSIALTEKMQRKYEGPAAPKSRPTRGLRAQKA